MYRAGMERDLRLVQLTRLLGRPLTTEEAAVAAIRCAPGELAAGLFAEAADNDDVTSVAAARDYLETRLAYFAGLLDTATAESVREGFAQRLRAWE